MGGAVAAVDNAYMKQQLVESNTARVRAVESGDQVVVGVNAFTETEDSPLTSAGSAESILVVDAAAEREQIESLRAFRNKRNSADAEAALGALRDALRNGENVMPVSIHAAHAGVTTGEWADTPTQTLWRVPRPHRGSGTTTRAFKRRLQKSGGPRAGAFEGPRSTSQAFGWQARSRRPQQWG